MRFDLHEKCTETISSLMTTIESHEKEMEQQDEKFKELLRVRISADNTKIWNLEDVVKAKDTLLESQKEEIERLNKVLEKIENDAYDQQTSDYARSSRTSQEGEKNNG